MKRIILALGAFLAFFTNAYAQDTKAVSPYSEFCQTAFNGVNFKSTSVSARSHGCIIENLESHFSSYIKLTMDKVIINFDDSFNLEDKTRLPTSGDIEVVGLRMVPSRNDDLSNILEAQRYLMPPIDWHIIWQTTPKTNAIRINVSVSIQTGNAVNLRIDGFMKEMDISKFPDPADLVKAFSIRTASLRLENTGKIETMTLPSLAMKIPIGEFVTTARSLTSAFIALMPEQNMNAESRTAIKSYMADFPRAHGRLYLYFDFDKPFEFNPFVEAVDGQNMPGKIFGKIPEKMQILADYWRN